MQLALYQPDIPQNTGTILRMAACLEVPVHIIGPTGFDSSDRALVRAGYASTVRDAFARLIGNDCPAYVPTLIATPEEVTGVILSAGGIPVWAHPPAEHFRRLLPRLLDAGLLGLEAYRATRVQVRLAELEEVARKRGLVLTGGSDWHGPESGAKLGDFWVTAEEVGDFLSVGGM